MATKNDSNMHTSRESYLHTLKMCMKYQPDVFEPDVEYWQWRYRPSDMVIAAIRPYRVTLMIGYRAYWTLTWRESLGVWWAARVLAKTHRKNNDPIGIPNAFARAPMSFNKRTERPPF